MIMKPYSLSQLAQLMHAVHIEQINKLILSAVSQSITFLASQTPRVVWCRRSHDVSLPVTFYLVVAQFRRLMDDSCVYFTSNSGSDTTITVSWLWDAITAVEALQINLKHTHGVELRFNGTCLTCLGTWSRVGCRVTSQLL